METDISHEDLEFLGVIGKGACAQVQKARHIQTGELFAVKMISNVFDEARTEQTMKEIVQLAVKSNDCDSIISLRGAFFIDGGIGLILEYMDRGSLEFISENPDIVMSETDFAGIVYQILWGLGYLHFDKTLHRDIKPANVLVVRPLLYFITFIFHNLCCFYELLSILFSLALFLFL